MVQQNRAGSEKSVTKTVRSRKLGPGLVLSASSRVASRGSRVASRESRVAGHPLNWP